VNSDLCHGVPTWVEDGREEVVEVLPLPRRADEKEMRNEDRGQDSGQERNW